MTTSHWSSVARRDLVANAGNTDYLVVRSPPLQTIRHHATHSKEHTDRFPGRLRRHGPAQMTDAEQFRAFRDRSQAARVASFVTCGYAGCGSAAGLLRRRSHLSL